MKERLLHLDEIYIERGWEYWDKDKKKWEPCKHENPKQSQLIHRKTHWVEYDLK